MRISVCVATYNGKNYIEDQITSMLKQLSYDDEVVVCDDCSTDNTVDLIYNIKDSRIKIITNKTNIGYIKNFEKAISLAVGDYIFLSDQDDIWPLDRVEAMIAALESSNRSVLVGGFKTFHDDLVSDRNTISLVKKIWNCRSGHLNIASFIFMCEQIPYFGSCMLIKKIAKDYVFPFPVFKVGHDIWIAISANACNDIFHFDSVVTYRRLHNKNLTNPNRRFFAKIITRFGFAWCWFIASTRAFYLKKSKFKKSQTMP